MPDYLRSMGASYFVSRLYSERLDASHDAWQNAGSPERRTNYFEQSRHLHVEYLRIVVGMNPNMLNTNHIGLDGREVVEMARELLLQWGGE